MSHCTAKRHGTVSAYKTGGCRCLTARSAAANYRQRRAAGIEPDRRVDATGTQRRLRALQRMGYPLKDLAARVGRTRQGAAFGPLFDRRRCSRQLADRVAVLYDDLSMTPGPSRSAAMRAARSDYPPPLAWDDIDNDPAPAAPCENTHSKDVDEVAVIRATQGTIRPSQLTDEERRQAVARLHQSGLTHQVTAERVGVPVHVVTRDHNTLSARAKWRGAA